MFVHSFAGVLASLIISQRSTLNKLPPYVFYCSWSLSSGCWVVTSRFDHHALPKSRLLFFLLNAHIWFRWCIGMYRCMSSLGQYSVYSKNFKSANTYNRRGLTIKRFDTYWMKIEKINRTTILEICMYNVHRQ